MAAKLTVSACAWLGQPPPMMSQPCTVRTGCAPPVDLDDTQLHIELAGDHRDSLVAWAQANGGLRELADLHRSLEDVFRDLDQPTGGESDLMVATTPVDPDPP